MGVEDLYPNLTAIPVWIIFMLSVFTLNTLVFKPTLQILEARHSKTVGLDKEVAYFKEQTEVKFKEYEVLMNEARNLARISRDEILKAADNEQSEIIKIARDESESTLNKIKDKIDAEYKTAQSGLKSDAVKLSEEIVEKLLERKVA